MEERLIIKGLIFSTEYIKSIQSVWDPTLLQSSTARRIASWCLDYYRKYDKAPAGDIEDLFFTKIKSLNISNEEAEDIEDTIAGIVNETKKEDINVKYYVDETLRYFRRQKLLLHSSSIEELAKSGEIEKAEYVASNFKLVPATIEGDLELGSDEAINKLKESFNLANQSLIKYPPPLGDFLNDQLVRGGLVGFLAPEKRGKTWFLIELAMRACSQGRRVAFFQAGDLSEYDFLRRISIYLAKKSNKLKYCCEHYEPVRDCIYNQSNECTREERSCKFGIFEDIPSENIKDVKYEQIIDAYKNYEDYCPCSNCERYFREEIGTIWVRKVEATSPLTVEEAERMNRNFFKENAKSFRLATYPNNTLTITGIKMKLDLWERQYDFVPDVIIIDYADLIVPETKYDFRHQQNEIWKGLRRLSQEKGEPLVITVTQSDAESYEKDTLTLSNFSEDKRKFSHVTAFFGLNQDRKGVEKSVGIMRINVLILREDEFTITKQVKVLQNLKRGRPYLGSFL
ncbi:MAG: hypothetical protein WBJ87_08470 [Candidatus Hydrothermia bacterium]